MPLAACVLASCAHTPPTRNETTAIRELREDYLRRHPAGRFNDCIARGEVAVGMSFLELLAAWGIPDARERLVDREEERWTYLVREDNWADWVRYDFVFAKAELREWETTRNSAWGSLYGEQPRNSALRLPPQPSGSLGAPTDGSGAPPRR
jgi:hypothetical protein